VLLACPAPQQDFFEGQPPQGVPANTPTVAIIGNLDLDGNVVPGSAVRVPRSGFSIPFTPPDELGSNAQGTNDWNFRFVSFEYENNGETYITDPCLLVDSEPEPPFDPTDYPFFRYSSIKGKSRWMNTATSYGDGFIADGVTGGPSSSAWRAGGTFCSETGVGGGAFQVREISISTGQVVGGIESFGGINFETCIAVSGSWEFSNDKNEVVATWGGNQA